MEKSERSAIKFEIHVNFAVANAQLSVIPTHVNVHKRKLNARRALCVVVYANTPPNYVIAGGPWRIPVSMHSTSLQ